MGRPTLIPEALLLAITFTACQKNDEAPSTPLPAAPTYPISGAPAFTASVDGDLVIINVTGTIENTSGYDGGGNPTTVHSDLYNHDLLEVLGGVRMSGLAYAGSVPTVPEFNAFFTIGAKAYESPTNATGVSIQYSRNGDPYNSSDGAQPGGSNFNITDVVQLPDDGSGITKVKVRATFNCTVFGMGGSSLTITNGIFVGVYSRQE